MKLFPPTLKYEDIKDFKTHDIFKRGIFAESLTSLVKSVDEPLVAMLDAEWGQGKSTFVRMWQKHLEQDENIPVIYFDAFENDFFDDPFSSLTAEVYSFAKKYLGDIPDGKSKLDAFLDKATPVGKAVLNGGLKLGIRLATAGLLTGSEFEDLKVDDQLGKETDKLADHLFQKRITDHDAIKASVTKFREELGHLAKELAEETGNLVFIIDELDRCKPTYALELIERVKHFFSVPGIVFVLVTNSQQLEESIRSAYGQGVNAQIYLRKFIHLHIPLAADTSDGNIGKIRASSRYLQTQYQRMDLPNDNKHSSANLEHLVEGLGFSLRDVERLLPYLSLYHLSTPENHLSLCIFRDILAAFALKNRDLMKRCQDDTITWEEMRAFLTEGFSTMKTKKPIEFEKLEKYVRFFVDNEWANSSFSPDPDKQLKAGISQILFHYNVDSPRDMVRIHAHRFNIEVLATR